MPPSPPPSVRIPLLLAGAGEPLRLTALDAAISPVQREQLAAYGLAAGRPLRVIQQRPLTVIEVDGLELALEHAVSRHIWVEPADRAAPGPDISGTD